MIFPAPSARNRFAMAYPIPDEPPVTMQVVPFRGEEEETGRVVVPDVDICRCRPWCEER
jgi:hypothetical protein